MKKHAKRLIVILLISALSALFASCTKEPDYFSYVSDLRKDVFIGENENFGVIAWSGARETPYAADGVPQKTALDITLKVTAKREYGDRITAKINYDEYEYAAPLSFHPVKSAMAASVTVDVLPKKEMTVTLIYGDEQETLSLSSALRDNTISYTEALEKGVKHCSKFVKAHTDGDKFNAEISVRLLAEKNNNYYYVGFVAKNGEKIAVLLDGETGEVLAEKTAFAS